MNMNRIHGKADWFFLNDFKWDFIIWAIYFLEKNIKRKAGLVFSIWMQKVAGTSQLLCEE